MHDKLPMGESNIIVSTYTMYSYLQQYCSHLSIQTNREPERNRLKSQATGRIRTVQSDNGKRRQLADTCNELFATGVIKSIVSISKWFINTQIRF